MYINYLLEIRVCLTCTIMHMLKKLKVVTFLSKINNYLLKSYIFKLKCTNYNKNLLF